MNTQIKLLDVVALLKTSELGLCRGQVGTIVEEYEPRVLRLSLVIQVVALWKH